MLKLFKSNSNKTKENEVISMKFEKTEKTVNLQTYNTRAIQLIEQQDLFYLQADKQITNIQTCLQIDRKTGNISEIPQDEVKSSKVLTDYSGFLGIINIAGVNFLMFVKDVHILSVLDGRDKIYEMVSLDFVQIHQSANKLSKDIHEFTSYIEKYLCSKNGGYYFSYTYPLTVSQQKINDLRKLQQNLNKPVFHLVDNDFLWNHHLLKPLVDQMVSKEWQAQLIQGHVYNVVIGSDAKNLIFYTIISRRQCKRGGTRYNHRGIDSEGYVANFVESEQIILFNSMKRIISHLQIRGSVPSYWTQRGISAKLIIESSRELSDQACSLHLNYLKNNYNNVICVDLMTENKQDELKLMTEFRNLLLNPSTESNSIGQIKKDFQGFIQYFEFDFHREVKGDKFENIDKFISSTFLQDLQNYGCFVKKYSLEFDQIGKSLNDQIGEVQWRQKGIVRTNCLDCLDRTNFFQLRVAFNAVQKVIFPYLGIELKNADFDNFCKDFQYSWGKNGDRISNHYAGTKATTSMVAKKGKSGVLGFIKGKLTSGQRFFKGIFTDAYKQQCYSVILGEHYETQQNLEYQENLYKELKQAESRFISHNNITIFVASWSVNSYVPDKKSNLNTIFKNNLHNTNCNYKIRNMQQSSIKETDSRQISQGGKDSIFSIKNSKKCDIVIVGLQEIVELSAKNILQISQPKSTDLQQKWQELIHEHIGGQQEYFFVDSHSMAGITTFIFARVDLKEKISDIEYDDVPTNLGGKFINKGGVGFRFWVDDTSIAVLNCHLPAGQSNIDQKISSFNSIHQKLFQQEGMAIYKRDPIWKSDKVILMGNLNFRVDKKEKDCKNEIQQIINLQKGGEFVKSSQEIQQKLISYDQLKCLNYLAQNQNSSQKENVDQNLEFQPLSSDAKKYFNNYISDCKLYLENYYEKKIHFLPTYKFEVGSDNYHNSWKSRVPSYSDRIFIWDVEKQNQGIEQSYLQYDSVYGIDNSDHKPIFAILTFDVKEIDYQLREQIIEEIILKQQGKTQSNFLMNLNNDDNDFYDQNENITQKGAFEKELLISEEFQKPQITSADVVGWSKNIIRTCEQQNIVEYTGQIFGVFSQDVTKNFKNYTKLPPHWSALVRLDLMLYGSVDADEGDFAGISIDSNTMDRYTKNDVDGYRICSDSSNFWGTLYNDAIYPYQKNVTHASSFLVLKIDSQFTGKNTARDYEGYAFKHVSVYVDTCYESCQTCNGPTSNQCTACIDKAVQVNGVCTCPGQLFAYNFECVAACPLGYVGNVVTKICEQSKCLNNCSNCVNQQCTKCNSPYKLINGECVSACPSYSTDKVTYCEDKMTGLNYGGYAFKGLYSSNFGDSEIQGQGLKLVNFKNGGATFSSCSGERFVGGWNVAGSGSEIRREIANFKPHWSIRIGFKYIMIDNWASSENIQVVLDNNKVISTISKAQSNQVGNICGNKNTEATGVYDYNSTHISSSLIISIKTNLDSGKSPFEASFGIRELFILVNYCQDNCLECNQNGCTKCPQGTYLYQYNCGTSCLTDLGYWPNDKTNTCDTCQGNCLTCDTAATSCLKCKPGTYLYNKSCSNTCPDGYAPNQSTLTCDKCHQNCKTCSNPSDDSKCTQCQGSRFLSGSQCVEICPNGQYGEFNGNKCTPCNANCLTCKGPTNADCLSCNINKLYQPDNNTCGTSCKSNQYINGTNCTPCDKTCFTCSSGTAKDCKSCNNGYLFSNQCLTQCPDQYYPDSSDKSAQVCKQCNSSCFNCNGPNQNQCTQCSGDLYLNPGNLCLKTCPDGQFQNSTNNKCETCDSNCKTCATAKNNCLSCNANQFLDTDGVCKGACPSGKWTNNTTKKCELCDPNCKACDAASKSKCTSCNSPLFLDKDKNICVNSCPSQYFGNQSSLQCQKCDTTCQECTGQNSNQCTQCSGTLYLDVNTCVATCQPGKFSNQKTNNCDLCDQTQCKECTGSSTNCTKCNTNLYLNNNNICQAICPKGYYANLQNGKCDSCNPSCETCFGPGSDQCTNCKGDLFFDPISQKCVKNCQQQYYANNENNQCMQCDKSCLECTGSLKNQCTKCPDQIILFNNQCISNCPDNYFKDPNAYNCIKCDSSCYNCSDSTPNSCTLCKGDLYLTPSKQCLQDCPDGTYKDNNICKKCDSSCLTCSGPEKTNCLRCGGLTYLEDNQCQSDCKNGWKNSNTNTCDACNSKCSKCNGPDENNCKECPSGTYLNTLDNTCGTNCPQNYYPNTSNNKCTQCDSSCKNCSNSGSDKCTECQGTLFLKDGKYCSPNCNDNEYGNQANNICEPCDSKCKTCKDIADQCTGCNSGTYLNDNKCETNCPDSTFKNDKSNICESCHNSCKTCSGPSNSECNSCGVDTFLDKTKNTCVPQCPSKYFGDSATNTCLNCVENCDLCSDDKICQKCSIGFFLHNGSCVAQCPTKYFNDLNNQQCSPCSQNCQTCFDATSNGCLTCVSGTFKNQDNSSCLHDNECPSGKYPDLNTQKCESCFSTCSECTGKDENQCKKCIQDKLFYKGECLKQCPSNTYIFDNQCIDCHKSCSTCSGSSQFQCLTCPTGFLQEGSCVDQCIQNYYPATKNGQQVCLQCYEKCSKCNGPDSNNCTECPSNSFMNQNQCVENCPVQHIYDVQRVCQKCTKAIKNNKCVEECAQNEYLDQATLLCQPCAAQCQTCYGPTTDECKKCSDGNFLDAQKNKCSQNCPDKYFPNKQKNLCEVCDPKCNTCSNSGDSSCLSCNSPLVLLEGKCLKDAPPGYYKDKDEFKKCHESCKTCDGPSSSDCLSCPQDIFILDKKCFNQCPSTYFKNESKMECSKCTGQCKECQSQDYCLSCQNNQFAFKGSCLASCDPILTFQDEKQKQCIQCHSSCNSNGCLGPDKGDCVNVGASGFDLLIVKILIFKTGLWVFSSGLGVILDYKNSQSFGKFGQVRPRDKQLSIHVSDNQVKEIIQRERKDMDFQGTQLNVNTSPNRRKRNILSRASMIQILPSEQTTANKTAFGDYQEAESPTKKSSLNFSSANIQSQLKILPIQSYQNEINHSPTSRSPHISSTENQLNFNDFKAKARPVKKSTLAKISQGLPTFQNIEDQVSSDNRFQQQSAKDIDSIIQTNQQEIKTISYPRKLYFTMIGNEMLSIITIYDPKRSRLFRSAMLYLKYLALFFMTYISQNKNYGVAALGLLAVIAGKGILQNALSQVGLCLRKAGLLSLAFVMILSGSDIYFWFLPKIQQMSQNLDMKWSFTYILLFTSDFLIIQSFISFISYIVTIRSNFVNNSKLSNILLNFFFQQPALLQNKN